MSSRLCRFLDDYLTRDLSGEETIRFETHVEHCSECQDAIQNHTQLNDRLTEAVWKLEPVPPTLTSRVRVRLSGLHRRRVAALVATASVAAAAVGFMLFWNSRPVDEKSSLVRINLTATEEPRTVDRVRVSFPRDLNVITVPIESGLQNVTIIWVYP